MPISTITTSIVSPRGIGVTALVFAPSGRRTRWLSIVQDCPHYGHAHAHCGSTLEAPAGVIAAGCRQGHYRLAPQTGVMS
ncbi:hypothetical protein ACSDR0_15290 [Streptosporangium sp. G11]|uniref:hypothetical protein n=1 Tax=Streptosporangium sp. G11 TaxID=3436926 RepID=UPI003EBB5D9E